MRALGRLRSVGLAFALLAGTACATPNDGADHGGSPAASGDSCASAHADGFRSLVDDDHAGAIARLGKALELCADDEETRYRSLALLVDIARATRDHCPAVRELHGSLDSTTNVDYLRASARLSHVCSDAASAEAGLSQLVRALAEETYGVDAPLMVAFVEHSQRALLQSWLQADAPTRALKDAMQALCSSHDVLSRVVQLMGRSRAGPSNPGAVLGLWPLQPAETLDADSRSCLVRVAEELERGAAHFSPEAARDAEQLIAWIRGLDG